MKFHPIYPFIFRPGIQDTITPFITSAHLETTRIFSDCSAGSRITSWQSRHKCYPWPRVAAVCRRVYLQVLQAPPQIEVWRVRRRDAIGSILSLQVPEKPQVITKTSQVCRKLWFGPLRAAHVLENEAGKPLLSVYHGMGTEFQRDEVASLVLTASDIPALRAFWHFSWTTLDVDRLKTPSSQPKCCEDQQIPSKCPNTSGLSLVFCPNYHDFEPFLPEVLMFVIPGPLNVSLRM